jgi:hypothetical protein
MAPRTADERTELARQELAARVRAAMGYAGLKLDDIVERCELVTAASIRRTVGARRETPRTELLQIAEACGVPWSWFAQGEWKTNGAVDSDGNGHSDGYLSFGEGTDQERIVVLETYVAVILRALAVLGIDATSLPELETRQQTPPAPLHVGDSR